MCKNKQSSSSGFSKFHAASSRPGPTPVCLVGPAGGWEATRAGPQAVPRASGSLSRGVSRLLAPAASGEAGVRKRWRPPEPGSVCHTSPAGGTMDAGAARPPLLTAGHVTATWGARQAQDGAGVERPPRPGPLGSSGACWARRAVPAVQAAATAVLPLGLGGQALPGPRAVGCRVVPGDVQHRVVRPGGGSERE